MPVDPVSVALIAAKALPAVVKGVSSIVDPNRKVRKMARKSLLERAETAQKAPENLGLTEDRIKKEVSKASENIDSQINKGTREARRGMQGQSGVQRGAESRLLEAAQKARAGALAGVVSQLRSADAALEKQEAAGIQNELMAMGFKQGPAARQQGMQQAQGAADMIPEATEDLAAAIKSMSDKYDPN